MTRRPRRGVAWGLFIAAGLVSGSTTAQAQPLGASASGIGPGYHQVRRWNPIIDHYWHTADRSNHWFIIHNARKSVYDVDTFGACHDGLRVRVDMGLGYVNHKHSVYDVLSATRQTEGTYFDGENCAGTYYYGPSSVWIQEKMWVAGAGTRTWTYECGASNVCPFHWQIDPGHVLHDWYDEWEGRDPHNHDREIQTHVRWVVTLDGSFHVWAGHADGFLTHAID